MSSIASYIWEEMSPARRYWHLLHDNHEHHQRLFFPSVRCESLNKYRWHTGRRRLEKTPVCCSVESAVQSSSPCVHMAARAGDAGALRRTGSYWIHKTNNSLLTFGGKKMTQPQTWVSLLQWRWSGWQNLQRLLACAGAFQDQPLGLKSMKLKSPFIFYIVIQR